MEKTRDKYITKTDKDNYLEILNETRALYELDKNGKLKIKAPSRQLWDFFKAQRLFVRIHQ